ncbi:unnamed protein product [Ilex paraguariensis]|uniref:Uncharacterized protein n=1 Tax=Ilex paraguariensis TaxID=185542 RepID=A0ABC8RSK4_9AQUA
MEDQAILKISYRCTAFDCEFWICESEKRRCTSNLVEKGESISHGVFGRVYMGMNLDSGGYFPGRFLGVDSVEVDLSIQVVKVLGSSPVKSMSEALE